MTGKNLWGGRYTEASWEHLCHTSMSSVLALQAPSRADSTLKRKEGGNQWAVRSTLQAGGSDRKHGREPETVLYFQGHLHTPQQHRKGEIDKNDRPIAS